MLRLSFFSLLLCLNFLLLVPAQSRELLSLSGQDPQWGIKEAQDVDRQIKWPTRVKQIQLTGPVAVYFLLSKSGKVLETRADDYYSNMGITKTEWSCLKEAIAEAIKSADIRVPKVSGVPPYWAVYVISKKSSLVHLVISLPHHKTVDKTKSKSSHRKG